MKIIIDKIDAWIGADPLDDDQRASLAAALNPELGLLKRCAELLRQYDLDAQSDALAEQGRLVESLEAAGVFEPPKEEQRG